MNAQLLRLKKTAKLLTLNFLDMIKYIFFYLIFFFINQMVVSLLKTRGHNVVTLHRNEVDYQNIYMCHKMYFNFFLIFKEKFRIRWKKL